MMKAVAAVPLPAIRKHLSEGPHPHLDIMKSIYILAIAFPVLAAAQESGNRKIRFRDAATHEQLSRALRKSEQSDPMNALKRSEGADPSKANQPVNLLEQSDIISFNGLTTLVPKRAILASPAKLKDRVVQTAGNKLVGWAEFYALNRGWITTVEVSRVQAEGNKPIAEETQERIGKSSNLVVATYMGGPISVLPLKEAANTVQSTPAKP